MSEPQRRFVLAETVKDILPVHASTYITNIARGPTVKSRRAFFARASSEEPLCFQSDLDSDIPDEAKRPGCPPG